MEKLDKKVVAELKRNLRVLRRDYVIEIDSAIQDLNSQTSIDGVMRVKKALLEALIAFVPITGLYCYFCIWHNKVTGTSCMNCSYGKAHGICTYGNDDNTWGQLNQALSKAQAIVIKSYWRGDEVK